VLEFRVLGEFEVVRDGATVTLPPSRKTRALLAYLALSRQKHRRERLCEIFWDVPDDPRGALRWSLSKIRPLVDDPGCPRLVADRQRVEGEAVAYEPYYEDPVVAYVAGPRGEADTYVFPAAGDSGCIIDYSRCVLGPAFRPRLEEGRSAQYATNFYRDQVNRVMRALHRYAPAYVGRRAEALKAAVLANFDAVFPVLCAADFVAIGRSVRAALVDASVPDAGEVRPFRVAPEGLELAARLEREALDLFVTGLHDLAEASGARRPMSIPAFPGAALLGSVFGEWRFASWAAREPGRARAAALVDAWRYGNELRYSGADYAKWPPWARLDEIERHLGGLKISALFERGVEPFLEALQPGARVEVIAERLRAEQEELDGQPVSTASSWLDE